MSNLPPSDPAVTNAMLDGLQTSSPSAATPAPAGPACEAHPATATTLD